MQTKDNTARVKSGLWIRTADRRAKFWMEGPSTVSTLFLGLRTAGESAISGTTNLRSSQSVLFGKETTLASRFQETTMFLYLEHRKYLMAWSCPVGESFLPLGIVRVGETLVVFGHSALIRGPVALSISPSN